MEVKNSPYLVDLGFTFWPLPWYWYARTSNCEDRDVFSAPPARDHGHTYLAGFSTEEQAKEHGLKNGWRI
jgi:hypothetical protein